MREFVIETERLILRPLSIEDCDAIYKWVSDEDVSRYMVYPTYTSKERLVEWIASLDENEEYHFGFVKKDGNELIGSVNIGPDAHRDGFLGFGYNFRKDMWGHGYATETAKAMIQFAWLFMIFTKTVNPEKGSFTGLQLRRKNRARAFRNHLSHILWEL